MLLTETGKKKCNPVLPIFGFPAISMAGLQ